MSETAPTPSKEEKVLISLSCGTNNPNRSVRALHLAQVAHSMGKDVSIFLLDEGVYLARKGITDNLRAPTGDIADDLLAYLQEFEVPIYACKPCAQSRQIREEDLQEGVEMAPASKLFELACGSTTICL
ncbi:MAG: DsrE family protein [Deltaproteobacteria bacterium]|nr:DsrE family protein [Deltaproteobacteria bacterium]MBW2050430.1 DsrE family protein [Deltaproteobacteria bacterium]MBW2102876.1 DsrE family protein [Deltaproteobacteria bacterium]